MSGKKLVLVHGVAVVVLLVLWAAATKFGWVESVVFVSHMSMLALVLAEIAAWQGARTEAKEDKKDKGK